MDNKSLSHTKWKCQYHIVFIPKYRKKILYGRVRNDVREIISTLCKYKDVDIIAGAVCVDHIHLSVAIPPKISIANFMGYLKGKSTLMLYDRHPELQSKWDKAFWARGYYVETIGNITDETVQKYIKEQAEESKRYRLAISSVSTMHWKQCRYSLRRHNRNFPMWNISLKQQKQK